MDETSVANNLIPPRKWIRHVRTFVQLVVIAILLWGGVQFYEFVHFYANGGGGTDEVASVDIPKRSGSIEGFLPIGGLMGFKFMILTGGIDPVHPAAAIMFAGALLASLIARKGFCGWICPVGAFSEWGWKIGQKILGRNPILPDWADLSLRSIKYLLMSFFVFIIGILMPMYAIMLYLISDYYKIVDVHMLLFFIDMSALAMGIVGTLFLLSMVYKNFWCRYLCPYGALLGLLGMASPLKVRRNEDACIHCNACTRNCPHLLDVHASADRKGVFSPECTGCLTCVSHCPAKGALDAGTKKHSLAPQAFIAVVLVCFFGLVGLGMATDNWQSKLQHKDMRTLIPRVVTPDMKHVPYTPPPSPSSSSK